MAASPQAGNLVKSFFIASNQGMDMVILPTSEEANGFAINTSYSGSSISLTSGTVWWLIAVGNFGPWQSKT